MDDEIHKQAFVGKKYEKLFNKKFSVLTLFFGEIYWAYRKMIVEAILLLVIKCLIGLLLSKIVSLIVSNFVESLGSTMVSLLGMLIGLMLLGIIVGIVSGFLFGPLYRKFVDRRVTKIKDKDICDSEADEITMCEKKGGTSILFLILFLIISSTISGKIYSYDDTDYKSNTGSDVYIQNDDLENENIKGTYDGSFNIESIELSKYINVDIPDNFEKDEMFYSETDYRYELEDTNSTGIFNSSKIGIFFIGEYNDSKKFIDEVSQYYKSEDNVYDLEINNINWNITYFNRNGTITYFNATTIDDKVLLYKFEIEEDIENKEIYNEFYKDVFASITLVSDAETEVLDNAVKDKIKTISDENDSTLNSEDESNTNIEEKEYDEYTYNILTNIDISKYIEIELPDLFEDDSTEDYIKEYSHKDGTKKDITFSISSIEAESAEVFIKDVTETNGLSLENDMYNTDVNGLTWYIVGFESDGKIIYYNATDYEDNVFLYRYEIDSSVQDEKLLKSYEDVIYSIKMNDEESDENSRD